MTATVQLALVVAALVVACILIGVAIGWTLAIRAIGMTARWARTGNITAPSRGGVKSDAPGVRTSSTATIEVRAAQEAHAKIVERGADRFMELEPRLTREQARERATAALEMMGAFNATGGIPAA